MFLLVVACGLIAAVSTLDPVLLTPSCGCDGGWFRYAEEPFYVPALAIALVAAVRCAVARTPPPSTLPMAVAGRARWRATLFRLRVRWAHARPLRWLLVVVNVIAATMAFLVLMVGLDGEVSDNAPFVVSHLVLLATVCWARIAENRRRRGLMVANRSGSGT